jgi:uncharacterized protein
MEKPDTPLTDAEFDELDAFLHRTGEKGLTVEGLDGFFAALVCSPVLARPSEWMPVVWGGEMPEWNSLEEAQRAIGLLMRMWNQVAGSINGGSFSPLTTTGLNRDGVEVTLPHAWCMGFHEGMRVHGKHWFDESTVELQELLLPIKAVLADAMLMLGETRKEGLERFTHEELNHLVEMIPDAVLNLRAYWVKHPVEKKPVPPLRGPKVGRNAPCPCGSGKKYNKCHGAIA